ncbi:hypothetical protein SDC9_201786 [bioreactor metagenome]|uniref:Uncharacterized protein n=1 Tax=bioreactor metagenome TaxID=1076179 RepID=A0A645ISB6_9ZZZZ
MHIKGCSNKACDLSLRIAKLADGYGNPTLGPFRSHKPEIYDVDLRVLPHLSPTLLRTGPVIGMEQVQAHAPKKLFHSKPGMVGHPFVAVNDPALPVETEHAQRDRLSQSLEH